MKKLIFLLFPFLMLAQNPTNFPYGIKNTVAPSNSTPSYFVTQEVDGVHKKTPAANVEKTANKSDSYTTSSSTTYASTKAVVDGLATKISGTGTTNYLPKFTSAGVLGNSQIFDNGSRVWIGGTDNGVDKLQVNGSISFNTDLKSSSSNVILSDAAGAVLRGVRANAWLDATSARFLQIGDVDDNVFITSKSANQFNRLALNSRAFQFTAYGNYLSAPVPVGVFEILNSSVVRFMVSTSNNVLIGTTTDNGVDKLQVNGSISATSYTGSATLTGTPTAPTATAGTNTTQIATTAFVQAEKNLIAHWTKTGDDIRNSNIGTVDIGNSYSAGFSAKTTINGDGYNSAISTKGKINSNIGYGLSDQSSGMFQSSGIVFTSYLGTIKFNPIYTSQTSAGTYNFVGFENQTIAPTSGGMINNMFNLSPIINQTGGANGITRGIYINPTLTSAFDFRAIEVTAGKVIVPVTTETAIQEYADNAAAVTAGLTIGTHYRTGDLLKIVH